MLHVNSFTMQLTRRTQTICFLFQVLNTEISLEDAGGKTKLAVDVFSKSLWFLKRHVLRHLAGTMGYEPDEKSIRWILTVPAIWDENAKQFMREAAHKVKELMIV